MRVMVRVHVSLRWGAPRFLVYWRLFTALGRSAAWRLRRGRRTGLRGRRPRHGRQSPVAGARRARDRHGRLRRGRLHRALLQLVDLVRRVVLIRVVLKEVERLRGALRRPRQVLGRVVRPRHLRVKVRTAAVRAWNQHASIHRVVRVKWERAVMGRLHVTGVDISVLRSGRRGRTLRFHSWFYAFLFHLLVFLFLGGFLFVLDAGALWKRLVRGGVFLALRLRLRLRLWLVFSPLLVRVGR